MRQSYPLAMLVLTLAVSAAFTIADNRDRTSTNKRVATSSASGAGAAASTTSTEETTKQALEPEAVAARIQKYRTAEAVVTILDAAGKPVANQEVVVEQVRHKFLFGCVAFLVNSCPTPQLEKAYRSRFADLFNYATLPFYHFQYEKEEGKPDVARLKAVANWCRENGITPKGHPLCWTLTPAWMQNKTAQEAERLTVARTKREVAQFAGLVDIWDVVNEPTNAAKVGEGSPLGKLYALKAPAEIVGEMFAAARGANAKATLVLNDFETTDKFVEVIQDSVARGATIDVIGVQAHQHHGAWTPEVTWEIAQRFAKLGKPVHFTETTILSGRPMEGNDYTTNRTDWNTTEEGEKEQAKHVAEFYTILFSHPAVEAITWWGLPDLDSWLGAPAGLIRKDMSPKPAYEALHRLIKKEWWTGPIELKTDDEGKIRFRGFLGDYVIKSVVGQGAFVLPQAGKIEATIKLTAERQK